jgi:Flp pilus assembly protein TadD
MASGATIYETAGRRLISGDLEGAITGYSECIALEPQNFAALNNLGVALIKAARFDDATVVLRRALDLQPGYLRALTNLGKALRETGHLAEAIERLQEAVCVGLGHAPALVNLGDALGASGDLAAAEQTLERAVRVAPALVEAHVTLGMLRLQRGRVREALATLQAAVALAPEHAEAHSSLGHALFVTGDWQAAWPHFEYRLQRPALRSRLPIPPGLTRWNGSLSEGLEVWLIAEQGLGDQLQFARYAKTLASSGVGCAIASHPRIVRLLTDAELADRVVPFGSTPSTTTRTCFLPLMSLPAWHGTRSDTVPAPGGYLTADPERVELWRTRLADMSGVRVALAWAGNPAMETGRHLGRSPPLVSLQPLMIVPNVSFVSVQKNAGEDQLDSVAFGSSIRRFRDLDSGPDAFLDTAAVLKSVDLLVTSDTSIAHLAGALGVPTWLCLLHEPDWRWMRSGSTTPWYTSMRLFRQPAPGDWNSVFREVTHALESYAPARS